MWWIIVVISGPNIYLKLFILLMLIKLPFHVLLILALLFMQWVKHSSPFPYDIYHTRFLGLVLVRPYRHFFIMWLITSIRFWVFYEYRKLKSTVRSLWSTWIGHSHGLSSCRVHQFESPQGHWRFTRSLTSGPRGISRGARKLARKSTVIKKKKKILVNCLLAQQLDI